MSNKELHGVIVPIITPIDADERVDEQMFRKLIRYQIESSVNGIFVGGSAGEGPLHVMSEWIRMVEIAYDEVKGEIFLLGGAIDTSTGKVVEKINHLKRIGYKYFVVTSTFYLPAKTQEEQLSLFAACREAGGDMEMIAYNIPACVGTEIAVETMCEMAQKGWIKYCKESSGDQDYFGRLLAEGKKIGLKMLAGDELTMYQSLRAGADGVVPVCANYEPGTFVKAYKAAVEKDFEELGIICKRILLVRDKLVIAGPFWLSGIKYAVSKLGLAQNRVLSPHQTVADDQKNAIDKLILLPQNSVGL